MRANHRRKTSHRSAELRPNSETAPRSRSNKSVPRRKQPPIGPDAARSPSADIFERISDAFVALDTAWRYTYVNDKAAQIFGRRREDLIGKHIWTEFPEGIGQPFYKAYYKAVETQQPIHLEEYYPPYHRWFENRIYPSRDGLTIFFQDVTDRRRAERELHAKNRALTALRACNHALVRMTDELDLMNEICRICVEIGGYRMGWVGYAERDEQNTIRPIAEKGFEDGYLDALALTWADTECGREPTGTAIRTGKPCLARNIAENPDCEPWRAAAIRGGYVASVALPLIADGEVLGVLTINAAEPDAFQEDEVALLEELSGDLAYGIAARRLRVERAVAEDQLRLSEEHLARLIKTVPDGIVIIDRSGRVTFANPAAEKMLGSLLNRTLGSTHNDPDWKVTDLDGDPIPDENLPFRQVMQSDQPVHGAEFAIRHGDGRRIILSVNASPLHDAQEDFVGVVSAFRDITERKRLADALEEQTQRLLKAQQIARMSFLDWNLKTNHVVVSEDIYRLYGLPRGEELFLPELLAKLVHPEDADKVRRNLELAARGAQALDMDFRVVRPNGDVQWDHAQAELVPDERGEPAALLGTVVNITERKHVEQALEDSEKRLALVFDTVSDLLFLIAVENDDCFRFVAVNPAFLAVTGLVPGQVVGKRVEEVLPESVQALMLVKFRQAIRDNKTVRWEQVSAYPTGTFVGEVAVTPARDADGHCSHLIGSVHDITEIRRAEEQVRQLNAELEERVVERTAQLQTANKDLEAFSYSVSHDLRAPLRAISGFAEILARRHRADLNEEGRHYLDNIVQASERMGRLIDDLLTFARLGRQAVRREPVPLRAVFDPLRRDLDAQLTDIHGTLEIAEDLPTVMGDKTLLNQIFANLLGNAITYRRKEVPVRVTVTWQSQDRDAIIRVGDNGIGIPSEYYEKIFNIFQRLHTEEEYPGTGIGLAIVKKSVELLGGHVWVESVEQQGSTFFVRLPRKS